MNKETFIAKYKPYYLNEFCMNEKTMSILRTLLEIDDLKLLFKNSHLDINLEKTELIKAENC